MHGHVYTRLYQFQYMSNKRPVHEHDKECTSRSSSVCVVYSEFCVQNYMMNFTFRQALVVSHINHFESVWYRNSSTNR